MRPVHKIPAQASIKQVRFKIYPTLLCLFSPLLFAQPVPVVLIDGYHLLCDSHISATDSFGDLDARLKAMSIPVSFLGTCSAGGRPTIEQLGQSLGRLIDSTNAPLVDVVAYSMGGLVARSYLSGKQDAAGIFQPPANPKVRKLILIASPNFGGLFGGLLAGFAPDNQAREMLPGSRFLFDLATWNQNRDDLREVDALAVVGNAGGLPGLTGASDGLVSVTSASLLFARGDERTRVIPYCHSDNTFSVILGGGCDGPPLAKVSSDSHLTWQIILSFITDSGAWKNIGHPPSADPYLSRSSGLLVAYKTAADDFDPSPPVTATVNGIVLIHGTGSIFYRDLAMDSLPHGTYNVSIVKPGPRVDLVAPSAARLPALTLAPNTLVSIYGTNLAAAAIASGYEPLPVSFTSDAQNNAVLPQDVAEYVSLSATTAAGKSSIHFLIAPSAPAIFSLDGSGMGAAAAIIAKDGTVITPSTPARPGDFVSLYLTGLGVGVAQPVVTVGGAAAQVTYAGASPNYAGVDQINFIVPEGVGAGQAALIVTANGRASNSVTLALVN